MGEMNKDHLILGAGPLGVSLARQLEAKGKSVRLLSIMDNPDYDMFGTQPEAIDGANLDEVQAACADASVVYLLLNAHYVDWYTLFPPRLEAALAGAALAGATFVYHDNVYMYGRSSQPYTEEMPYTAKTRKGKLRAEMAEQVLAAHQSGEVDAVIGRTADMYGPGALNSAFNSTLGQRHFYPAMAGETVNILGDIDLPHTYAFVDDVARDLITLATQEKALGQVWHLPAAPTMSQRELMTIAFKEIGLPAKIRGSKISGYFLRGIGLFQKDVAEVAEMLYQFEKPFVVSHQKFEQAFGANPTPHEEAMRVTLEWYKQNRIN